jgi:signal transduction histidine kinase/PAS domain-containing protein/ActR/RegA family two-component response regulator
MNPVSENNGGNVGGSGASCGELIEVIDRLPTVSVVDKYDEDGVLRLFSLSDEFCKLMGISQAQAKGYVGSDAFDPVHPDDVAWLRGAIEGLRGSSTPLPAVFRSRDGLGSWRWLSANIVWFRVEDDEYVYLLYTDVTGIKQEKEGLEAKFMAEQSYLESVSNSFIATIRVNLVRDVVESVGGSGRLTDLVPSGISYSQLLEDVGALIEGSDLGDFLRTRNSCEALLSAYERGEREVSRDYQFRPVGGGPLVWNRFTATLLGHPSSGDVIAFMTIQDINEEKIEQEILERLTSGRGYDFVGIIDPVRRTLVFRRIADATLAAEENVTYDYDATVRANTKRYYHDEEEGASDAEGTYIETIVEHLAHEDIYSCAFNVEQDAGMPRRKLMRYGYLDASHEAILATRTDVTSAYLKMQADHERLKGALATAEAANAAKSDFLARMSHDIRTPLNGILGMTALALDEPDRTVELGYLRKIRESGNFLLSLVNDILDLSKAESGKMELRYERYSYPLFIRSLESVIVPLCEEKSIVFTVKNPYTEHAVLTDPLRLNQIFYNLLSNAVKFTPRGGHVWFELSNHKVEEGRLSIDMTVADDGIGMTQEFQSHLFEPFTQEHSASNQYRSGTGLGLAITKELVDLMGGTISVRSAPGEGSAFTVRLSFRICPDVVEEEAPSSEVSLEGVRILLAEDNAINAEIAMRMLEKRGASVVNATDGERALRQYAASEQYHFDLILMDVRMPVLDGLEATRRIRSLARPDSKTVPIVAMTANAFDEDVEECLAAGMNAHVAKPVDAARLYEAIARQLAKNR